MFGPTHMAKKRDDPETAARHTPRRCDCSSCSIKVESMPWAIGKSPLTAAYAWVLASWAKVLSRKETARRSKLEFVGKIALFPPPRQLPEPIGSTTDSPDEGKRRLA